MASMFLSTPLASKSCFNPSLWATSSASPGRATVLDTLRVSSSFSPHRDIKLDPLQLGFSSCGMVNEVLLRSEKSGMKLRGGRVVCRSAVLSPHTLQWISVISSVILMFAKAPINKSFLVPLLTLQAPSAVVSWIKGEQGLWTAFLALLIRLFFFIPGELELPFQAMLLLIIAPYQSMNLRGTTPGAIISLVIAAFLAYQHFSRTGSLQRSFDQGAVVATLALICVVFVPCFFLFG